ncbi:MAG: hypothetical protein CMM07_25575 [Rhodopirellula sp.]|nr:hypothetical protein [Rhodopirellula sp.]
MTNEVQIIAYKTPLLGDHRCFGLPSGKSVAEIIFDEGYPISSVGTLQVSLANNEKITEVPRDCWMTLKPKSGSTMVIAPKAEGAFFAPILGAISQVASPYIAGQILGAGASKLALKLATTAISIVFSLAVNALVKPPVQSGVAGDPAFTITGVQNGFTPFGTVPQVWGRHLMFPTLSATGYTELDGEDVYYRGRMTFGVGPDISLEQLRIGTTPISEFSDIEIEFRNVNQSLTEQDIPELEDMDVTWLYGDDRMQLYPDDITEDVYRVLLEEGNDVTRFTRPDTKRASIDISFDALGTRDDKGRNVSLSVTVQYQYRRAGASSWISAGTRTFSGSDQRFRRFVKDITFPDKDTWEISVTRTNEDRGIDTHYDDAYLTAIRSTTGDRLQSHPDLCEIAFRMRATDQLNGQIDSLNAIVNRLLPVWNGSSFSSPQKTRHVADIMVHMLRGAGMKRPVDNARIDLDAFLAYRSEEPHWTFDIVYDGPITVRDMMDQAAAAGRVRRSITEVKHSLVRDGSKGAVRAAFSPHNTWGFSGRKEYTKEIHGLKVAFISEAQDFQQDEAIVYADGYNAGNATEFEDLPLTGVVVASSETELGNVYRLARYHMAVAKLRPETFEFFAGPDHLVANVGDKIVMSHDVTKWAIGSARIADLVDDGLQVTSILTDEIFDLDTSIAYALRVRDQLNQTILLEVLLNPSNGREFFVQPETPLGIGEVNISDMVLVEEVGTSSQELIITSRVPNADLTSLITAVPAAPEVLDAETGVIPDYNPNITKAARRTVYGPATPEILSAVSDETTMIYEKDGTVSPVLEVTVKQDPEQVQAGTMVALRWREKAAGALWSTTAFAPLNGEPLKTDRLLESVVYEYQILPVSNLGRSGPPTAVRDVTAKAITAAPPKVEGLAPSISDTEITWTWEPLTVRDIKEYIIRYASSTSSNWNSSTLVSTVAHPSSSVTTPLRAGRYFIRARDYSDQISQQSEIVDVSADNLKKINIVSELEVSPVFSGTTDNLEVVGNFLRLSKDANGDFNTEGRLDSDQVVDLGEVFTCTLKGEYEASTDNSTVFMSDWTSLSDVLTLALPEIQNGSIQVLFRLTEDEPGAPGAVWTDWTPILVSTVTGRAFQFAIVLKTTDVSSSPLVVSCKFILDMPDRSEYGQNVTVPLGGVQITYDTPFREPPSFVTLDKPNLPTDRLVTTNETNSGVYVEFLDDVDATTFGEINWQAQGYGRQKV